MTPNRRSIRRVTPIAALLAAVAAPHTARAYCLLDVRWTAGVVRMSHNFPTTSLLINGTTSWEENAASAMAEWSSVTPAFEFIDAGMTGVGQSRTDGVNNMLFDDNVFGDPFDENVLAITFSRTDLAGNALESDIIFNNAVQWNAYNGPTRVDGSGHVLFDFRRVALHELGHVLGLDHPDEACLQAVDAIMNAQTTDTDSLTIDDRNGISFLYAGGNQAPIAEAGPNLIGDEGERFILDASASADPDGQIVTYEWQVDGSVIATSAIVDVTLAPGTHVVLLTVTDDQGATATDTAVVTVGFTPTTIDPKNLPPVAVAGDDLQIGPRQVAMLDGSQSFDPDGVIERYVWSRGSAVLGRDALVGVALPIGTHRIALTVFDDGGAADTDSITVVVLSEDDFQDTGPVIDPTQLNPPDGQGGANAGNDGSGLPMCGPIGLCPLIALCVTMGLTRIRLRQARGRPTRTGT